MKILVLSSRIPYPLEKGDKLRLYHQLRHLSVRHQIILCCLSDRPMTEDQKAALSPLTQELIHLPLRRIHRMWRMMWRLADMGKEIQLLRPVRTFSTNNHKRSKRMACYFPSSSTLLPSPLQVSSGRLRSAQLGSAQPYQPGSGSIYSAQLLSSSNSLRRVKKGSGGWENSSRRRACLLLCGVCVLLHFHPGPQLDFLPSCPPSQYHGHTLLLRGLVQKYTSYDQHADTRIYSYQVL